MEETESIDVQNQAVILAYVKRGEDPNTILFSDDARKQDILRLFNDP